MHRGRAMQPRAWPSPGEKGSGVMYGEMTQLRAGCRQRGAAAPAPLHRAGGSRSPSQPFAPALLAPGLHPCFSGTCPTFGVPAASWGVPAAPVLSQASRSPARCCGHRAEPHGGAAPCLQRWGRLAGSSPCPRARWGHLLFLQRGPPLPHHHHRSVLQASCPTGVPCAGCVQRCGEQNGALGTNPGGPGAAPGAAPEGPAHHGRSWTLLSQAGHCAQHRLASTGQGQAQAMGGITAVPAAAAWVVRRGWGSTENPPGDSSPPPQRQHCLGTLQRTPQDPLPLTGTHQVLPGRILPQPQEDRLPSTGCVPAPCT